MQSRRLPRPPERKSSSGRYSYFIRAPPQVSAAATGITLNRDRAAVVAAAILQIMATAPDHERQHRSRTTCATKSPTYGAKLSRTSSSPMHNRLPIRCAGVPDVQRPHGVHVLHRDYETRSTLDLRRVGVHRYADDPSTDVLCCAYAADDQPVRLWIPGDPVPPEFIEAASNPNWVVAAHGDHFEIGD